MIHLLIAIIIQEVELRMSVTKDNKLSSVNYITYDFPSAVRVCSNHSYVTKYIPPTGTSKVLIIIVT